MSKIDRIVLIVSLLTVLAGGLVAGRVFERMAHLEDEFAYLWQARVIARGDLTIPSPDFDSSFLVPFVVDHQGQRFGKYPLGWPVMLSLGVRAGIEHWINPLLGGMAVWLTYRLGKRLFGEAAGLLAAVLTGLSPIFLIQSGSLLSHNWSLLLSVTFMLSWLDLKEQGSQRLCSVNWLPTALAGASLGVLGLTRPMTMAALALPFGVHGLFRIFSRDGILRRKTAWVGVIALVIASLHFVWQRAVTGSFTLNPYTLWWPYDRLGFGEGIGVKAGGHSLRQAWWNTKHSLRSGLSDLFGWAKFSWILLPPGLWAARKRKETYLLLGFFFSLVLFYMAYWVGSWLLGPRYYYEALPGLSVLSAVGILWLAGWPISPGKSYPDLWKRSRTRPLVIFALVGGLLFINLRFYLPARLASLQGLYTIERSDTSLFRSEGASPVTPALIIVHSEEWMSYGSLQQLSSPYLDSPMIFAWSIGPQTDRRLAEAYRDQRRVYHYYPNRFPEKLFSTPQQE